MRAQAMPTPTRSGVRSGLLIMVRSWAIPLLFLAACEGVQVGGDALTMNLPPDRAQQCRDAVRGALAEHNITESWIRRVHYQAIRSQSRRGSTRTAGFEAWVFPKQGGGAVVVELSNNCDVRRVWAQGTR